MNTSTIFVELVNEGTECWRPVEAEQLSDSIFRIIRMRSGNSIAAMSYDANYASFTMVPD
jgi:hypothetical protein